MEVGIEEFVGSSSNDVSQIAKGKRTKRLRLPSPNGGSNTKMSCSSSISTAAAAADNCGSFSSTATCNCESTGEEEDMANCLILLARGDSQKQTAQEGGNKTERFSSRRFASIATSTVCKTGIFVYACKTCNRAFPSFQALGGHRASHKKPKFEEKKLSPTQPSIEDHGNLELEGGEQVKHVKMNRSTPPQTPVRLSADVSAGLNQSRAKMHECSICGSEFSSGQALGGHMRRHRAATSTGQLVESSVLTNHGNGTASTANPMKMKSRNTLELDLNLPAPEDDNRDSTFQYASTQRPLVLSPPALVDCHY